MLRQPGNSGDSRRQDTKSASPATADTPKSTEHRAEVAGDRPSSQLAIPHLALPKGGGAIRGVGEKFAANPVTGTASLSIPIFTSPGRAGFALQLALAYDSGAGNGPFGLGWHLSVPAITRKTDKGLPKYQDGVDSDTFILAGAEDLVPSLIETDRGWVADVPPTTPDNADYSVRRYRPRVEGAFARIERWEHRTTHEVHWRSVSRDNVTSLYGMDAASRIADPADPQRVFSWLLYESYDDKGNVIRYEYKAEDAQAVDPMQPQEKNRLAAVSPFANRYLKRIWYGNRMPNDRSAWLFTVVFDYGDHDSTAPTVDDSISWPCRQDPFSSYRAGFEVRTYRLCRRVLMFHHFAELGDTPCLVRSTDFSYRQGPAATYLTAVTQTGYLRNADGSYHIADAASGETLSPKSLPPLEFTYTEARVDKTIHVLDPDSVENLPLGLDGTRFQWVDLDSEGLSGILTEQADAWYYKRNLGDGHFGPLEIVAAKPSLANLDGGQQQLLDLAGDGHNYLVQFSQPVSGYYERTGDGGWESFTPFPSLPRIDWHDPQLRFVDLDGDGHADLLVTEDEVFVWYPSQAKDGFGPAEIVRKREDEEHGPALVFADATQSIYLADMAGDGLTDIVRIRNGEVCYWPNRGYGRFGAKVTMDGAPWFDQPDMFSQRRIRLADIDGSGTTDIVYLGRDSVSFWINQAGNSWSAPTRLAEFPAPDDLASVNVVDLLGNGTACIVWSSPLPADAARPMRYIDLMSSQKPHLLASIRNNLGAETRLAYAPSTRFYLADRLAGQPWATRLPFPVHVLEQVEVRDWVTGSKFVTRYAYHHGFYDGVEREFRGFGLVEQWDSEEYAPFTGAGLFPASPTAGEVTLHVPPIHTRTWFHTGAYFQREQLAARYRQEYYAGDSQAWSLPAPALPANLTAEETREAYRALKGQALRQEIYADDGSTDRAEPYSVAEHGYALRLIQPMAGQRHAVFYAYASETLEYHYERNPADPRIGHQLTLDVDAFGNATKSAAIGYPRRAPAYPEQAETAITYTETDVVNAVDGADHYRVGVPVETRTYELIEMPRSSRAASDWRPPYDPATLLPIALAAAEIPYEAICTADTAFQAIPLTGAPQKRLIERVRSLYFRDDLTGPAPLGQVGVRALPHASYKLAFTPGLLDRVYGGRVNAALLSEGGYRRGGDLKASGLFPAADPDDVWWIPSGWQAFDSARFYLPVEAHDPFGATAQIRYDTPYSLVVAETEDPLHNVVRAATDYRVLQPYQVVDANGNRAQAAFDVLGMVVGTAVMGKEGASEGDSLDGFAANLGDTTLLAHIERPLDNPQVILGRATTRLVYDIGRYARTRHATADGGERGEPGVVYTLARETHDADLQPGEAPRIQHSFHYSDGFGRELQVKAQAEPGPAPARDADGRLRCDGPLAETSPRWVGTGRTVYNNKGQPVKQYEPFFSPTHAYEDEPDLVQCGVTPILHYDPLGRVVRTDLPNGTYSKVEFDPWQQATWDPNDTVLDSRWYAERGSSDPSAAEPTDPETLAAWLAAAHAGTPGIAHLDSLGRTFLTVADNGTNADGTRQLYATGVVLDIEGNARAVIDARHIAAWHTDGETRLMEEWYDMLGRKLRTRSADAGESWALPDIAGQPLRAWDGRGHAARTVYDSLRRPTHHYVSKAAASAPDDDSYPERLMERTVYGDSDGAGWTPAESQAANLRGRVYRHYDGAGVATSEAHDFKGNLLRSTRRLARDPHRPADWSALDGLTHITDLDAAAEPFLEGESFRASTAYDALNRPVSLITPHTDQIPPNEIRPTYNEAGLLERVDARLRDADARTPFVTNIDYDAKGQRTRIVYGNGVSSLYTYDPLTFRLTMLRTVRPARAAPAPRNLQWLRYTYDPVGNITAIRDDAQQTVFFDNSRVEPSCRYVYDALYRLVRAEGREHAGQNNTQRDELDFEPLTGIPHPNDPEAMQRYVEEYVYDAVGNILSMAHMGGGSLRWTRAYTYAADSNRLLRTSRPDGGDPGDYRYDAHGNMVQMPHLPVMAWDHKDQLHMTQRQVSAGDAERTYYVYDAGGERVRKVTDRANGTRRAERIYLGGFEVYREYAGDGTTVTLARETLHVMDGHRRIALVETKTLDAEHPLGAAQPLARYQLDNHLGSACLEVDDHADVVSYEEYHPYGTSAYRAVRAGVEVSPTRYRYTGKERDEETGLGNHGARYYAPWLGRWASADLVGNLDGINLFEYCRNDPIGHRDLAGRQSEDVVHHTNRRNIPSILQRGLVPGIRGHDWLGTGVYFNSRNAPFASMGSRSDLEGALTLGARLSSRDFMPIDFSQWERRGAQFEMIARWEALRQGLNATQTRTHTARRRSEMQRQWAELNIFNRAPGAYMDYPINRQAPGGRMWVVGPDYLGAIGPLSYVGEVQGFRGPGHFGWWIEPRTVAVVTRTEAVPGPLHRGTPTIINLNLMAFFFPGLELFSRSRPGGGQGGGGQGGVRDERTGVRVVLETGLEAQGQEIEVGNNAVVPGQGQIVRRSADIDAGLPPVEEQPIPPEYYCLPGQTADCIPNPYSQPLGWLLTPAPGVPGAAIGALPASGSQLGVPARPMPELPTIGFRLVPTL